MTDITPEFSFDDAFAQAEAAALAEAPAAEETVAEAAPSEQARDEAGRFAAAETPAVEAETVEETTTEAAPAPGKLLAGKYKTVEDLERAYTEAQRMIPESADWRREMEALRSEIAAQQAATTVAPPVQITQEMVDTNPGYAARLAFEQNNGEAFAFALERWQDEQPAQAAAWVASKHAEDQVREVEQRYEAKFAELERRIAPAADAATQQQQSVHVNQAVTEFPEIPALLESGRIAELAAQFPGTIGAGLISADPAVKAEALKAAAGFERGRQGDTLTANVQDVARIQAEEARKAAEDAYVASSTTATAAESVKLTAEQEVSTALAERFKARTSFYDSGWERPGS